MLNEKCMLVELVIRQCAFRKLDKTVTQEVNWNKHAKEKAARVNKSLIEKEYTKNIQTAANSIRVYHYKMTMPYNDGGMRILPILKYEDYTKTINDLINDFKKGVETLVEDYDHAIDRAKDFLGDLYDPMDYPDKEIIRQKFQVKVAFSPVPELDTLDRLAGMSKENIKKIKADVEQMEKDRTEKAMADIWGRLHDAVSKMSDTLQDPDKIFRDSLVGNVLELVDLLPAMNITDDPNLDNMRKEVEKKLCQDTGTLRKDKNVRKETAKEAKKLADAMSVYF